MKANTQRTSWLCSILYFGSREIDKYCTKKGMLLRSAWITCTFITPTYTRDRYRYIIFFALVSQLSSRNSCIVLAFRNNTYGTYTTTQQLIGGHITAFSFFNISPVDSSLIDLLFLHEVQITVGWGSLGHHFSLYVALHGKFSIIRIIKRLTKKASTTVESVQGVGQQLSVKLCRLTTIPWYGFEPTLTVIYRTRILHAFKICAFDFIRSLGAMYPLESL